MRKQLRSGFSIFELLVILAILGFLFGLLLPAIARVREAAARMQSQNNMKQIALAWHNYADVNRSFPSGVDKNGFSALTHLLPYVEQANLFQKLDLKRPITDDANKQIAQVIVPVYVNKQDTLAVVRNNLAPTSYQFCAGTKYPLDKNDGVAFEYSKLFFADITDGTSNTIMAGETLVGDGGNQAVDVRRQHVQLGKDALKGLNENSGVREFMNNRSIVGNRGASWMDGRFLQATFTATRKVNDIRPDVDCGGTGGLSGLRTLGNIANVAMCDGSVRALNTNVAFDILQAIATRNGGEVVQLP